jgi:hypothetical protein
MFEPSPTIQKKPILITPYLRFPVAYDADAQPILDEDGHPVIDEKGNGVHGEQ